MNLQQSLARLKEADEKLVIAATTPNTEPDWNGKCDNCGASPILPCTGMCGPCTFGEAETAGGNW